MKKAGTIRLSLLVVLCLVTTFSSIGNAEAASGRAFPLPMSIVGTSWTGEMTTVDSSGSTTLRNVNISFDTQEGSYISGLMTDADTRDPLVTFSGIIGPLNPYFLHLTGPSQVLFGDVVRRGRLNRLFIRGGDTSAGSSFMGVLTRQ